MPARIAILISLLFVLPGPAGAQPAPDPRAEYLHALRQVIAVLKQPAGTHNLFVSSPDEPPQKLRQRRSEWDRNRAHAVEMFARAGTLLDEHDPGVATGPLPEDAIAFSRAFTLVKVPAAPRADRVKAALVAAQTALTAMIRVNLPADTAVGAAAHAGSTTAARGDTSASAACDRLAGDLSAVHVLLEKRRPAARANDTRRAAQLETQFVAALKNLTDRTRAERTRRCGAAR